jgi:hypothetical protein
MNPSTLTTALGSIMFRDFMDHGSKFLGFVYQPLKECKVAPIQHFLVVSAFIFLFILLIISETWNPEINTCLYCSVISLASFQCMSLQIVHSVQNSSHLSPLSHFSVLVLYLFLLGCIAFFLVLINLGL